eukprot:30980-Pelagococcus_subviridis.AAC.18
MRHALRGLVDRERALIRRHLRVRRPEHGFDHEQRSLIQRLRVREVPARAVQLRQRVVKVRYVQRLRTGEPVREIQRALVAKLALLPFPVRFIRRRHLPQVLRDFRVVRAEHVLEPLERAFERRLRGGAAPNERLDERRDVGFFVPGRFRGFPDAHGVRRELPRLLVIALFSLDFAQLPRDLRDHRGFAPDEELLRRERPSKRFLRFENERGVPGEPSPHEKIGEELFVHVRGDESVRAGWGFIRLKVVLSDDVASFTHRRRVEHPTSGVVDFPLAFQERFPLVREVDLRIFVPQQRVHARIRQRASQPAPLLRELHVPHRLGDVPMRRREVFIRKHHRQAKVLPALLRARGGVPSYRPSRDLVLKEARDGITGQAVDRPAVRLELRFQARPRPGRHVRQRRRLPQ